MSTENERDLGGESLFTESLSSSSKSNYLGDPTVLETLLRTLIHDASQATRSPTAVMRLNLIGKLVEKTTSTLLGKNPAYIPMRNWNQPGSIDVFLKKWAGSLETQPSLVVSHSLIKMLNSVFELAKYADEPGVLKEHWDWQLDALISQNVSLFLGIDPVAQAVESLGTEQPSESDDNDVEVE